MRKFQNGGKGREGAQRSMISCSVALSGFVTKVKVMPTSSQA